MAKDLGSTTKSVHPFDLFEIVLGLSDWRYHTHHTPQIQRGIIIN